MDTNVLLSSSRYCFMSSVEMDVRIVIAYRRWCCYYSTIIGIRGRVNCTGLCNGLHDLGILVLFPEGLRNFLLSASSRLAVRPCEPYIQWILRVISSLVKPPERESGHSNLVSRSSIDSGVWLVPRGPLSTVGQWARKHAEYWISL